jgi:hypothetical protein
MSAMEGIEFKDLESFKTASIEEFSKTNDTSWNKVKELYRIILIGPKEDDLIDFELDIIIQNKLADVSFTVIKDEILKFFPLQIQEKVENAKSWQEVRLIINRNKSILL